MKTQIISVLAVAFAWALVGCGPEESRISSDKYVAGEALSGSPLEGSTLEVDVNAGTARVTFADGTLVDIQLAAVNSDEWSQDCRSFSSAISATPLETFKVTPSPLQLGSLTVNDPTLTAGCRKDSSEVVLRGRHSRGDDSYSYVLTY